MPFPITLTSYRASSEVGVSRRARSRTTTSSPPPRASVFLAASRTSRNRREKDAGNRIDAPVSLGQHITTVSRRSFGVRGDDAAAPLGSAGRNSQLVETSLRAAYRPTVPWPPNSLPEVFLFFVRPSPLSLSLLLLPPLSFSLSLGRCERQITNAHTNNNASITFTPKNTRRAAPSPKLPPVACSQTQQPPSDDRHSSEFFAR